MIEKDVSGITIRGYEKIAGQYRIDTDKLDMTEQQEVFMGCLKGKRILDVGCGPGRDAEYFVKAGYEVYGIDLTENFLEMARERVPQAIFEKMDMRDISLLDQSFDGVWADASLLHLKKEEIDSVVERLNKILVPRGILYASLKRGEGERLIHDERYGGSDKYYAYYGLGEVEELMENNMFDIFYLCFGKKGPWIDIFCEKK